MTRGSLKGPARERVGRSRTDRAGGWAAFPRMCVVLLLAHGLGCAVPLNWERPRSQVGLGLTFGVEDFDLGDAEDASGGALETTNAPGLDFRFGHRVHPQVELELLAQSYGGFEITDAGSSSADVDMSLFAIDLKLYEDPRDRWFPDLGRRLSPYLVFGLGFLDVDLSNTEGSMFLRELDEGGLAGRAGLGLETSLSRRLAWFVEGAAVLPFGDLEGLNVYGLTTGLQWRF